MWFLSFHATSFDRNQATLHSYFSQNQSLAGRILSKSIFQGLKVWFKWFRVMFYGFFSRKKLKRKCFLLYFQSSIFSAVWFNSVQSQMNSSVFSEDQVSTICHKSQQYSTSKTILKMIRFYCNIMMITVVEFYITFFSKKLVKYLLLKFVNSK